MFTIDRITHAKSVKGGSGTATIALPADVSGSPTLTVFSIRGWFKGVAGTSGTVTFVTLTAQNGNTARIAYDYTNGMTASVADRSSLVLQ